MEMEDFESPEEYDDYMQSMGDMEYDRWRDDEAVRIHQALEKFVEDEVCRKNGYYKDRPVQLLKSIMSHCQWQLNKLSAQEANHDAKQTV